MLIGLVVALAVNIIMFVPAYIKKSDKFTDISYAVTFVLLTGWFVVGRPVVWDRWILASMVVLWAIRLGGFLLYRVKKVGFDKRFDNMRENWVYFLRFWVLQGLTVWVVLLAAMLAWTSQVTRGFDWAFWVGVVVWVVGLGIEAIADVQKFEFKQNPENKNKWIDSGVWSWSRHPNYLGEMMVWIGVYIFCMPLLSEAGILVGLISPVYICFLLMFVTGVPILEKNADTKWGNREEYLQYKKRVGVLLPKIF